MILSEYQEAIKPSMAYSPTDDPIGYHALGLAGEVGEVCNKLKKYERGDYGNVALREVGELCESLAGELGGVCWYASALRNNLQLTATRPIGLSPKAAVNSKRCGLELARAAGVISDLALSNSDLIRVVVEKQTEKIYSHVSMLGWWIGVSLGGILAANFELITDRHARGVVHGNGDHR